MVILGGGGSTEKTTEFQTWGRNSLKKSRVQKLKKTCDFEGWLHRENNTVFWGLWGLNFFRLCKKT